MLTQLTDKQNNNPTLVTWNTSRRVLRTCGYKIIQQADSQLVIEIPKSHQGRQSRLIQNIIEKQRQHVSQETSFFPRFQQLQQKRTLTYQVRCACGQPFKSNLELSHFEFKYGKIDRRGLNSIVLAYEALHRWHQIQPVEYRLSFELDCLIKRCFRCQQSAETPQILVLPKVSNNKNCKLSTLIEVLEQLITDSDSMGCHLLHYINRLKDVKTIVQLKEELRSFPQNKLRLQGNQEKCQDPQFTAQIYDQAKNNKNRKTKRMKKVIKSINNVDIKDKVYKAQSVETKRIIYNINTLPSQHIHQTGNRRFQKFPCQRKSKISTKVSSSRRNTKNSIPNLFMRSSSVQRSWIHHQEDLRKTQNLINTLINMKNRYNRTIVNSERGTQSIDYINLRDLSQFTQENQLQNVIQEIRGSEIPDNFIDIECQDDTECQKRKKITQISDIIGAIDRSLQKNINLVGESINEVNVLLQKYDHESLVPLYLLYKKFFYMRCTFVATLWSPDNSITQFLSTYQRTSFQNSRQYQQKINEITKENKQIYHSLKKMYSKVVKAPSELDEDLLLIDMGDSQTTYNRFIKILLTKNIGGYIRIYKGIKQGRENAGEIESLGKYGLVIMLACFDDMEKNQTEKYVKLIQKWSLRYSQSTQETIQSLVKQQKLALQRLQA